MVTKACPFCKSHQYDPRAGWSNGAPEMADYTLVMKLYGYLSSIVTQKWLPSSHGSLFGGQSQHDARSDGSPRIADICLLWAEESREFGFRAKCRFEIRAQKGLVPQGAIHTVSSAGVSPKFETKDADITGATLLSVALIGPDAERREVVARALAETRRAAVAEFDPSP